MRRNNQHIVSVGLSDAQYERLRMVALKEDRSLSHTLRRYFVEYAPECSRSAEGEVELRPRYRKL